MPGPGAEGRGGATLVNEGEMYFSLWGNDFDPDAVTRALEIEPSRVQRQAVPRPKMSSWVLSSGKLSADMLDVYDMGEALISRLSGSSETIRRVAERFNLAVTLQVVLTVSADDRLSTPAIGFSAETVQFLASVGASIDIDTYRGAA